MLFDKLKKIGSSLKASCPEGSVHAWEFRGVLYGSKEKRDEAELKYKKDQAKEKIERSLAKYMVLNLRKYVPDANEAYIYYTYDKILQKRVEYAMSSDAKLYSVKDMAAFLIARYPQIKEDLEVMDEGIWVPLGS